MTLSRADVRYPSLLIVGWVLVVAGCPEGAPPVTYPPPDEGRLVIKEVSQSPTSVGPGDLLRLGVTVTSSRGGPLSFSWAASTGIVGAPVNGTDRGDAIWTSLSCLPPDVTPTVTVTVTHGSGLSTSHTFTVTWTGPACTRPLCAFSLQDKRVALEADCTTDSTLFIPEDFTFDGQDHTVTAVDPPGGHFAGAVLRNRGGTARVRDVTVTASGLKDICEPVAARRLRGIQLEGASGEVVDTVVHDLGKGLDTSGCQEGFGIEVRNDDASRGPFRVDVLRNRVSGYQKLGVLIIGAVEVMVADNTLDGRGSVAHIARNGIQISNGAKGRATGNTISGNAYTGPAVNTTGAGILVTAGSGRPLVTGLVIENNVLTDNDVGISLSQHTGPTRVRVAGNVLSNGATTNPYYQAAIADSGTGNIITSNIISGVGYTPVEPPDKPRRINDVDVTAGPVSTTLVFLTAAQDIAVGACSGKMTVQSQDSAGNLVPSTESFALESSGPAAPGVTFHAHDPDAPGCTGSPIITVDLSNPQAEASFYFKASQPGTAKVSVSGGSLSTASQDQTIH